MARTSFKTYRSFLGLPGTPVEWIDRYSVSDTPLEQPLPDDGTGPDFPDLRRASPTSQSRRVRPTARPFRHAGRAPPRHDLQHRDYGQRLLNDFLLEGGEIERASSVHRADRRPARDGRHQLHRLRRAGAVEATTP